MGLGNSRLQSVQSNQVKGSNTKLPKKSGIVYEVILDEENPLIPEVEVNGTSTTQLVGAIRFRLAVDTSANTGKLQTAYPKNLNLKSLPLKNEIVSITTGPTGNFFYERTGTEITPNNNSNESTITNTFGTDKKAKVKNGSDYQRVASTGISRSTSDDSNKNDGFGDYFESDSNEIGRAHV